MLALAEFVMRRRLHALVLIALFSALPLLSWLACALVALVTLRKGHSEGAICLLAGLLPLVAIPQFSDPDPAALMASQLLGNASSIATLVVVTLASVVLRISVRLDLALIAVVGLVSIVALAVFGIYGDWVEAAVVQLREALQSVMQDTEGAANSTQAQAMQMWALQSVPLGVAVTASASLLLGRWWQSALYNPGGFQAEFHALRLSSVIASLLLALGLLGNLGETLFIQVLSPVLGLPLLFAGIALTHFAVKHKQMSVGWLWGFYLLLPLTNKVVLIIGWLDSIFDFRKRWAKS